MTFFEIIVFFYTVAIAVSFGVASIFKFERSEKHAFYKPKPKPPAPPANESPEDKKKREEREKEEKRRKAEEERKRKQKADEDFEKIYKPRIFLAASVVALIIVTWTVIKKIVS